jgi:hypothetical protein
MLNRETEQEPLDITSKNSKHTQLVDTLKYLEKLVDSLQNLANQFVPVVFLLFNNSSQGGERCVTKK